MSIGELVVEFIGECVLDALSYLTGRALGSDPKRAREVGLYVLLAIFSIGLFILTVSYS